MASSTQLKDLFTEQVDHLGEPHFLTLFWAAQAEGRSMRYNLTNCFDDLKHHGITRTKQSAVAVIDSLAALCFIVVKGEGNRRNLYISPYGARALEQLVLKKRFNPRKSAFLEGNEP